MSLIRTLDKERFRLFLFTAQEGLLFEEALSIERLQVRKSRYLERPINPVKDILAIFEIKHFIKENDIDIVHTHSSKAGILGRLAAKLAKARFIVHTVHGWSFNENQPFILRKIYILLERFCASFTDKIVVVSEYDKKIGLNLAIGSREKFEVVRYGIDYKEFNEPKTDGVRKEFGVQEDELLVGMIGCFKPQKSPLDFLRLANLITKNYKAKFILIGDGVLRKKIEKAVSRHGLKDKVILTGWRRDISCLLSAMDIFTLTSLWEGLPVSVLEAMRLSRPVIATDTGGIAEVIKQGENGYLVCRKDVSALAEKLETLLKDPSLRKQIGDKARDSLGDDFRLENMAAKVKGIYESAR